MKLGQYVTADYRTTWADFAADVGGELEGGDTYGVPVVTVLHRGQTVRVEGHVTHVWMGKVLIPIVTTRLVTLLPATPAHRFTLTRASFASAVATWFGSRDVQVGDAAFDDAFVLKGESPSWLRECFADASLRQRLIDDFDGQLHRQDDAGAFSDPTPGQDPFVLDLPGLVESAAKLRACYALYVHTLDRMTAR